MTSIPILPLGFAQQVMDLQMKLQDEQCLQTIQILSQMYRIAVDFYIQHDVKRAKYFQNKLNNLVVKSLTVKSIQNISYSISDLPKKIKKQMSYYEQNNKVFVQGILQIRQKIQRKLQKHIENDLIKQQQIFQNKMLRRVKSSGRLV